MLKLENVSLTYFSNNGEIKALNNISFEVKEGEFVAILGPSGSGKTTILSLISGLLKPTKGKIEIKSDMDAKNENATGYMFQKDNLFEWRTVLNNIYLGLEIQKQQNLKKIKNELTKKIKTEKKNLTNKKIILLNLKERREIKKEIKLELIRQKEYAENLLKKYGLWEFKDKYPHELSGGMRQRVALIRTLTLDPKVLLLDEPFSALDYQTRLNLCDDVYNIIKSEGKTAILVTHDITEALSMANRIIILSKRPAEIKEILTVNENDNLTPLKRRESGKFLKCFDKIWKELQEDEEN